MEYHALYTHQSTQAIDFPLYPFLGADWENTLLLADQCSFQDSFCVQIVQTVGAGKFNAHIMSLFTTI